ncbi:hypothetical protein TRVL_06692 [Trypanosoma vivax]|nr:hypothetical protein TRVL_06692 [Trypanosoma vivax]
MEAVLLAVPTTRLSNCKKLSPLLRTHNAHCEQWQRSFPRESERGARENRRLHRGKERTASRKCAVTPHWHYVELKAVIVQVNNAMPYAQLHQRHRIQLLSHLLHSHQRRP